jgi:tripartite-type tricarboxylate transporter receptor subunit TctC
VSFFGVVAPAGTPASIVNKLNAAINQSLESPDMQSRFAKLALQPKIGSAQDFSVLIAAELKKWFRSLRTPRASKLTDRPPRPVNFAWAKIR